MLTLSRREGEALIIELAEYVDPSTPVGDVLADGLYLQVSRLKGNQVKLSLEACMRRPRSAVICRGPHRGLNLE